MKSDIALFFDHEETNLVIDKTLCPNVIPIKVPSAAQLNESLKLTQLVNYYNNSLDEGSRRFYACLKAAIKVNNNVFHLEQLVEHFDVDSGLNSTMMNNTINALSDKTFNSKYKISTCIFNINRTILKNNGFMYFPEQFSIKRIRSIIQTIGQRPSNASRFIPVDFKKELNSIDDFDVIVSNTNIRIEMTKIKDSDIANCFLGGNKRAGELASFFKKLSANHVNTIFLSNDPLYCPDINCEKYSGKYVDRIEQSNYNLLFFDILVAAGIIANDFNYFMENMMVYNNINYGSNYKRIANTYLTKQYYFGDISYTETDKHPITKTCLRDINDAATAEVQSIIMKENGSNTKPLLKRIFGRGGRTLRKKHKRHVKKSKRRTTRKL
jgi:hypothetical protein